MLGLFTGDLSEHNILVGEDEPVIIDLPQAIDAAGSSNAAEMLERDVVKLRTYFSTFATKLRDTQYGKEIWTRYESRALHPELALTGYVPIR